MIQHTEHPLTNVKDYRVVPLREQHVDDAAMLGAILRNEPDTQADPRRNGFFWIDGGGSRFYVNVHQGTRTVYLVTVARSLSLN